MPSERNGRPSLRTPKSALRTHAFTLVEMLTVIAIIGILAAILIPTIHVIMDKARRATATADVSHLYQAATAYNLDFGAFPPDCTAFWTSYNGAGQLVQSDNPFPGTANTNNPTAPLNPNELLMWYLTMQYRTGAPAVGYPAAWNVPPASDSQGDWPGTPSSPSNASVVFSRVNAGPYFDIKAKQKTDLNRNGFYEFMDPWGRPYMYRAYPQLAQVTGAAAPVQQPNNGPWTVTLTLNNLTGYTGYTFYMNSNLTGTIGSIQLTGFSNANYNGAFTFVGGAAAGTVNLTFTTNPGVTNLQNGLYGYYTFPLHNQQTCDIYSLGPYGLTRASSMPIAEFGTPPPPMNWTASEWKPTHGGAPYDNTSLDAWPLVWGTPGDGNDISSPTGNVIIESKYQDNICNWN